MLFVSRKRVRAFTAALLPLCKVDQRNKNSGTVRDGAQTPPPHAELIFLPRGWGGPRRCAPYRCGPRARSTLSLVILTLRT